MSVLRDALRLLESMPAASFVYWRGARRFYHNGAARAAFPRYLGESGASYDRATPFVRDLIRSLEGEPESGRAFTMAVGDLPCVAIPLFSFDGTIDGAILRAGSLEDVPAMYRELQSDASLLSQVVHLLPLLIFTVRPNGEQDFVNRTFVDFAGLPLQHGRYELDGVVHEEDRALLPMPWQTGNVSSDDIYMAEVRLRRSDGDYRWHALRLGAIRSRRGAIVKWIGTFVDIDDRRLAEAWLGDVNARLDARADEIERVLDIVPVGIAIANGLRSDEVRLNRALMRMLGESRPYVPYGHRALRYLRGVDLDQIGPSERGEEVAIERPDGTVLHLDVSAVPLHGIGGDGGVVAAFVDVSERLAQESRREALIAAHRALALASDAEDIYAGIERAVAPFADMVVVDRKATAPQLPFDALRERSLVVAFAVEGRVLGSLTLRRDLRRPPFDLHDHDAFVELGTVVGIALDRARLLARERFVAGRLNRLLLPTRLPRIDGVDISVAYRVADRDVAIGGDWYDAFVLSGDLVALSIGDIAGHGLDAAIAMYAMRQAMRDAAFSGAEPSEVLAHANDVLLDQFPDRFATAGFAIVDRARSVVRYALAGHPPPILAGADGARTLDPGGMPLGVDARLRRHEDEVRIDHACALAFYTDGLTEYRRDALAGEAELRERIAALACETHASLAEIVFAQHFAERTTTDDAALLIAKFTPRT